MESKGEIIFYKTEDGKNEIEVHLQEETVWLNQSQLTKLFGRDQSVISRHIKNIFKEEELDEKSSMHFLHIANSDKPTAFYNLNVIISVGYRVKSKRGTQFRIWATTTLKDHVVKGYTINEKRLEEQQEKFKELHQTVEFLKTTLGKKNLTGNEAQGLLEIISKYTRSFVLLNQFDSNSLKNEPSDRVLTHEIKYKEAIIAIKQLKKKLIAEGEASDLFGRQREEAFSGILNSVVQTFDGEYLYPSIEEQAAPCFTSLSKTILLPMVINASALFFLFGFCTSTNIF